MKLLLAMLLVPSLAFASHHDTAEKAAGKPGGKSRSAQAGDPSGDPMAGWVPPKVKNEAKDKQEIQALIRGMEAAGRSGDLEAAAALVDFPVMMMTDDSKGQAMGDAWTKEQWTEVMRPFYEKPMKDMKVTHKPTIFLLSDSLASVDDVMTVTQGGRTITGRSSMFLIRRDGAWRVKAMAEGGWGDMMAGAEGTASGTHGPGAGSAGGASAPPAARKGETDVQTPKETPPAERTTQ